MDSKLTESAMDQTKPKKRKLFEYGNYSRYYGYRNSEKFSYHRLELFKEDWFKNKTILDVGCNSGHLTLAISKKFAPKKIIGVDVDDDLIQAAKKNVKHYFPKRNEKAEDVLNVTDIVNFITENYVDVSDDLQGVKKSCYDTILLLSVSKWIHLNWGDVGLKRCFRRIHEELKPGGVFVLEPQPWKSYKKKKKVTETSSKNYKEIEFKPNHFCNYLIEDIGFSSYTCLNDPKTGTGFDRPLYLFVKTQN